MMLTKCPERCKEKTTLPQTLGASGLIYVVELHEKQFNATLVVRHIVDLAG